MNKSVTTAILLFAISLVAIEANAQTVKKWVDDEGVTHYSDQKPVDEEAEIKEIEMPEAAVTKFESEEATERIKKQLQQMEQDRRAREQEAEAKERAKTIEEALERDPIVAEEKKKKKKKGSGYEGPYPKPPPGPFPKQFPDVNVPGQ